MTNRLTICFICTCTTTIKRGARQEKNAEERLARAQQHANERRIRADEEIVRLKRDYLEMAEERRENDRIVEETKKEADELEKKVGSLFVMMFLFGGVRN